MKKTINSYRDLNESKYLLLISMLYVVFTTVPSLFLYRLIQVGHFIFPGGMFIFPMIYVLGDIIAEIYGYKIARNIIWFSLICNFTFSFAILSVVYLPAPQGYEIIKDKYLFVFKDILRGNVANIAGVLAGNFLNAFILTKLKILVNGRMFIVRSLTSSAIGALIMIVLWATIAFSGKLKHNELIHLAVSDYVVRIIYAILFAIPSSYLVKILKNIDKIDIYDSKTNFNPFKLELKDR